MVVWEGELKVRKTVNVHLHKDAICRRLGYGDRIPSALTLSLIESQIQQAHKLIKPAYIYELKVIEGIIGDEISVYGSVKFTSRTISYVPTGTKRVPGNDI